ncbi:MAG: FadR family transcriptional regulator [Lentisphaeria bacterium]|nr:FadR family transcriptional regulator [Lentisphaeria bacterium]
MIEPVKIQRTVEAAIENIGAYIATLHEGDVLPGERELAGKLQISRNITREALQHFRTLGIIASKPKIGSVVVKLLPANPYAGYMPFIAASRHSLKELLELRFILESGCCDSAVRNVSDNDIAKLQNLAERIKAADGDRLLRDLEYQLDVEFHSAFLRLSRNALLESLIPLVVEFFSKNYLQGISNPPRKEGYDEHFLMVEALKNRDSAVLRKLVASHLSAYDSMKGE